MGGTLQVVCQDTGSAIPEPEKGRVFELSGAKGLESLGLCVAATVARAHGGRTSVRSQEGVGNAFLMELPMTDAAVPSGSASLAGQKVWIASIARYQRLECNPA